MNPSDTLRYRLSARPIPIELDRRIPELIPGEVERGAVNNPARIIEFT